MCKWLKNNFESYTYYYFVVISTLITTIILHLTNIDNNFFQLYEYNYASINTSGTNDLYSTSKKYDKENYCSAKKIKIQILHFSISLHS